MFLILTAVSSKIRCSSAFYFFVLCFCLLLLFSWKHQRHCQNLLYTLVASVKTGKGRQQKLFCTRVKDGNYSNCPFLVLNCKYLSPGLVQRRIKLMQNYIQFLFEYLSKWIKRFWWKLFNKNLVTFCRWLFPEQKRSILRLKYRNKDKTNPILV